MAEHSAPLELWLKIVDGLDIFGFEACLSVCRQWRVQLTSAAISKVIIQRYFYYDAVASFDPQRHHPTTWLLPRLYGRLRKIRGTYRSFYQPRPDAELFIPHRAPMHDEEDTGKDSDEEFGDEEPSSSSSSSSSQTQVSSRGPLFPSQPTSRALCFWPYCFCVSRLSRQCYKLAKRTRKRNLLTRRVG